MASVSSELQQTLYFDPYVLLYIKGYEGKNKSLMVNLRLYQTTAAIKIIIFINSKI